MAEASSSHTFREKILDVARKRGVRAFMQRVEDKLTPGVADIPLIVVDGESFAVESKHVRALPSRPGTVVKFDEPLKPEQVNWLENLQIAGGRAFVVCRVKGVGWMLFDEFRGLHEITREAWDQLPSFLRVEDLINHILKEMKEDENFGRRLWRKPRES